MTSQPVELEILSQDQVIQICSQECGAKCCKIIGTDLKVPVTMRDFQRLREQNLNAEIEWDGMYPHLKSKADGSCVFLCKNNMCSIYRYRPQSCGRYPFLHPRENVNEFCLLDQQVSKEQREKIQGESEIPSLSGQLFDLPEDDVDHQHYLEKLNT